LAQALLVDFLLAVEVVLVLVEERVPGLGREVRLGELGVDPGVGLGLGAGLWVIGLGQLVAPTLWLGLVLGRGISSGVARC
jgi:hypothetical protein